MRFQKQKLMQLIVGIVLMSGFSACYRMPTENDYSVVPTTNNPAVTCEKNTPFMPQMGY